MFKFKSKKSLVIFSGVIVLAVLICLALFVVPATKITNKPWSVIYLATGEIYVGQISKCPVFHLKGLQISGDSYILQVVKTPVEGTEELQTNFQLTPIKEALWAPKKLYLNREQVVFFGPVSETSKVAEAVKEADKW